MLINKDDMNINMNINKSLENMKIIEMIFRKKLNKEFKYDKIEKFYLIII